MRRVVIAAGLGLATGCGASWGVRDVDLGVVDCRLKPWFADADADGWGEPGEPVWSCEAEADSAFTARNDRDCDDADAQVTARLGDGCPVELLPGLEGGISGWVGAEVELIATFGAAPLTSGLQAEAACAHWGGELATPANPTELAALQALVDTAVPEGDWAGFLGVAWDGEVWAWTDSGLPFEAIGLCDGDLPVVTDLEGEVWESQPLGRLALVRAGGGWCLGAPGFAPDLLAPGEVDAGWLVCERPKPVPEDYKIVLPEPEDEASP